jgi:hypothetical protein
MLIEEREATAVLAWCAARTLELHQQAAAVNAELRVVGAVEALVKAVQAQPAPGHFASPVLEANRELVNDTIAEEIEEGGQ